LKAYANRSIGSICNAYKSALKVAYNTLDITVFIEKMVEKKPDKVGLYLALGILYQANNDNKLALENFKKFIACSDNPDKATDVLRKKGYVTRNE